MGWSFQIYSSRSLVEATAIISELEDHFERAIEEDPEFIEKHEVPDLFSLCEAKHSRGYEIHRGYIREWRASEEVAKTFASAASFVELDRFDMQENPVGISILAFLLKRLNPCVVLTIDSFDLGEDVLKELSGYKSFGDIENV